MNNLIETIEPALSFAIKMAERQGLDEIRISVPRARMMVNDLKKYKQEMTKPGRKEPKFFDKLDSYNL